MVHHQFAFFADSFNTLNVWYTLDVLMLIGLAIALIFNYARKREEEAVDASRASQSAVGIWK